MLALGIALTFAIAVITAFHLGRAAASYPTSDERWNA